MGTEYQPMLFALVGNHRSGTGLVPSQIAMTNFRIGPRRSQRTTQERGKIAYDCYAPHPDQKKIFEKMRPQDLSAVKPAMF